MAVTLRNAPSTAKIAIGESEEIRKTLKFMAKSVSKQRGIDWTRADRSTKETEVQAMWTRFDDMCDHAEAETVYLEAKDAGKVCAVVAILRGHGVDEATWSERMKRAKDPAGPVARLWEMCEARKKKDGAASKVHVLPRFFPPASDDVGLDEVKIEKEIFLVYRRRACQGDDVIGLCVDDENKDLRDFYKEQGFEDAFKPSDRNGGCWGMVWGCGDVMP